MRRLLLDLFALSVMGLCAQTPALKPARTGSVATKPVTISTSWVIDGSQSSLRSASDTKKQQKRPILLRNADVVEINQEKGQAIVLEKKRSSNLRSLATDTGFVRNEVTRFLASSSGMFYLTNPENIRINKVEVDKRGTLTGRGEQIFKGYPVYGADFTFNISSETERFSGRTVEESKIVASAATLDSDQAIQTIRKDLQEKTKARTLTKAELKLVGGTQAKVDTLYYPTADGLYRLSYRISYRPNLVEEWIYFINATDGTIISRYNNTKGSWEKKTFTGEDLNGVRRSIHTAYNTDENIYYLQNKAEKMYDPENETGAILIYDANFTNATNLETKPCTSKQNEWTPLHVSTMWGITQIYHYFNYHALTHYLTATSRFTDLRLAIIRSARELYEEKNAACAAKAFDEVGIWEDEASISEMPALTTPSVTDNGKTLLYVGEDYKIYRCDLEKGTCEVYSEETPFANVAISKDGKRVAAVAYSDDDPNIYVRNLDDKKWIAFGLYTPATEGTTYDVKYADHIEFDLSGEALLYDAYNETDQFSFWNIGALHVWDAEEEDWGGEVNILFTYNNGFSVGNPTFFKNSPDKLIYETIDQEGEGELVLYSTKRGILSSKQMPFSQPAYPTFGIKDEYIALMAYDEEEEEEDEATVFHIALSEDKNSFILPEDEEDMVFPLGAETDARYPVYYGSYDVTLTVSNAHGTSTVTKKDYIVVGDDPTSVEEVAIKQVSVHPNPATTYVIAEGVEQGPVLVYSVTGKLYANLSVTWLDEQSVRVDVSSLPDGLYILKFQNGSAKFMKQQTH